MRRNIFEQVHDDFRKTARAFFERECAPHAEQWERDGKVSRQAWRAAGEHGLIGWALPEKYGGLGITDYRFNQIVSEEFFGSGAVGIGLGVANDILVPYLVDLTTDEQKDRWLPKFISGEFIGSIAMSEPAAGSDLAGIKTTARDEGITGWSTARRRSSATGCCPRWCSPRSRPIRPPAARASAC